MDRTVVVVAEHADGKVKPCTFDAVVCAHEIRRIAGGSVEVVVLGEDPEHIGGEIARETGCKVTAISIPGLNGYNGDIYRRVLAQYVRSVGARHVCAAATPEGADFVPGLAVRLHASCITGVESVFRNEGTVCFRRSIAGGKIVTEIKPLSERVVITAQPGCSKTGNLKPTGEGSVDTIKVDIREEKSRSIGRIRAHTADSTLTDAAVVVAAGRGVGKQENLSLVRRLASMFSRPAVAGSRPVCDYGWLEYGRQVGLTGTTVSPALYIACGISGTSQHTVGMSGSGMIVAINNDPEAPIFSIAHVGIVEDLSTFIPVLLEEWSNK